MTSPNEVPGERLGKNVKTTPEFPLVPRCTKAFAPIERQNYSLEALKLVEKQRRYRYLLVVSALLFIYLSTS